METDLTLSSLGAPVRLERKADVTVKSQGEGSPCVHQCLCKSFTVRESACTAEMELLSVSVQLFYLPTYLLLLSIYTKNAINTLNKVTHKTTSLLMTLVSSLVTSVIVNRNQ